MAKKLVQIVYQVTDQQLLKAEKAIKANEKAANDADKAVNKFGADAQKAGKNASESFLNLGNIWKGIIAIGITAYLTNLAKKTFELGVKQEQLNIAFNTFLGSAEKAKKLLADLTKFAIVTPFSPDQVNNAAKALLAFGVRGEEIIPTLKMLGDVSAGTGKDLAEMAVIFGQIRSTGRLMGQDLLQLINAGFNPLQVISEKTGKSVATLKNEMEKGLISFQMVSDAFKTATEEGGKFNNLMEAQSKSVGGVVSAIEGNFDEALKNIFAANTGRVKAFVDYLALASEGLIKLTMTAEQLMEGRNAEVSSDITKRIDEYVKRTGNQEEAVKVFLARAEAAYDQISKIHREALISETEINQEESKARTTRMQELQVEIATIKGYIAEKEKEKKLLEEAELKKSLDADTKAREANANALKKQKEEHTKWLESYQKELKLEEQRKIDEAAADKESARRMAILQGGTGVDESLALFGASKINPDIQGTTVNRDTKKSDAIEKERREMVRDYALDIMGQILNGLIENSQNEVDVVQDKYDKMIAIEEDFANRQQDVAGTNARAKLEIETNTNRRKREIEKQREIEVDEARKRQAKKEKEVILKRMAIETILNGIKALGTPPAPNYVAAGLAVAYGVIGATAAAAIGFKDGVIGLNGPGTTKSDSIPARLSRGESVITAEATSRSRNLLEAIQSKEIDDRILNRLVVTREGVTQVMDDTRIVRELQKANSVDYYERGHMTYKRVKKGETLTEHVLSKYRG